ncbi:MAG TPA: DUF2269 family protein [Gaiellaceae bacterium]|nr:DUF2269 family protein [Gaiellaceae bacterium]
MTWFELWLFLHVLGAITWIGGAIAIQVFGVLTKRAADPAKTVFFIRNVSWLVMRVFLPAAVVVFISGVGLVETGFWDYDETFVTVGIILWLIVALVAFGFLGRAMARAGARLEAEGPSPPLMLTIRNLVWTSRALLATLVVIVFLMTVKPWT